MAFSATSLPLKVSALCKNANKLLTSNYDNKFYCLSHVANILTSMHKKLNGSLIVNPIYDHGHKQANGEWTGMMKSLVENKSDVAVGMFSALEQRFAVTKFSPPLVVWHD